MNILPVGAELFFAEGQTGEQMAKQIVASGNFANALKNYTVFFVQTMNE
jgi:hypothetical protein